MQEEGGSESTWAGSGTKPDDAAGRKVSLTPSAPRRRPNCEGLRCKAAWERRAQRGQGTKAPSGRPFPRSISPRRPGEGASPDSMHQLLLARRGRAAAAGAGGAGAQLSPNSEVCKQKRGPTRVPQLGDEPRGAAASERPGPQASEAGPRSRARTRCTDPRIPRPDPSLSARAQKAAVNVRSPVRRGLPALCANPPGSPPRESGPERSTDRQGERPVSVAENPGLAGCTSQGRTHTHETHASTRTPSPKLIKKKSADTYKVPSSPQVSADLPLPGRPNANAWTLSLPFGAGHLGATARLPPDCSPELWMSASLPSPAPHLPPRVWET